jgi:hypothetical protein
VPIDRRRPHGWRESIGTRENTAAGRCGRPFFVASPRPLVNNDGMAIRGSCLCGGVTFEIDRASGPAEYCHCSRCRKVTGSMAVLAIGVQTKDYRLLTGRELIRTYAAPILYEPPAYQSTFCSRCGSPVPVADPEGDFMEIAAGLFDDDPGIRADKHIFVELRPDWDETRDGLPEVSIRDLYKQRTGRDLPADFELRTHRSAKRPLE